MSQQENPANVPGPDAAARVRVPMSVPQLKLEVPPIPGFHLHWMRGDPQRIAQAQRAGYEFVTDDEVMLNNSVLGSPVEVSGNTDLGGRVSMAAGGDMATQDGQPMRLFLMKIRQEWFDEDQKALEDRTAGLVGTLSNGLVGAEEDAPGDTAQRYVGKQNKLPGFFKRKAHKR